MSRLHGSLSSRLKALKDQVGWRRLLLIDRDGREVFVPTIPVVDAYLYAMAHDGSVEGSGLEPSLVLALARIPVRASMCDMESMVVRGARRLLDVPTGIAPRSNDQPAQGGIDA